MLIERWNKYYEVKTRYLNLIQNLYEDELNYAPGKNQWSIKQVTEHLALAEKGTLTYLQKKILGVDKMRAGLLKSQFNYCKLYIFLRSKIKIKAPGKFLEPSNSRNLDIILNDWNEASMGINNFIELHSRKDLNKNIFRHPLVGRMNMKDTLRFLKIHIEHHIKQVYRIAKSGGFIDKLNSNLPASS